MLPKPILSLQYRLASQSIPVPLKGLPGKDFLLFDFEPPETAHKLKVFPEDAGFICSEAGRYRITTLRHDFSVPFTALECETQTNGAFGKVFLLRFQPAGSAEIMKLAATVKYIGDDLKDAGDETLKYEWASKIIESMKA